MKRHLLLDRIARSTRALVLLSFVSSFSLVPSSLVPSSLVLSPHLSSLVVPTALASSSVHTTYLWHMHQPIYWPDASTWNSGRYETAYETITLGHSQNDVFTIFNSDDRVAAYQSAPRDAVDSIRDLPEAGAQVSFAGALIENLSSLGDNGWNSGRYAADWYTPYRIARSWTNSAGKPRLGPVLVGFHHAIGPLMDDNAFRMELACAKAIYDDAWGDTNYSRGFFPAEMCFSERLIPALVDAGVDWSIVPDLHIARACEDYPYAAHLDNCDPPNPADQINPAQVTYTNHFISRGVTLKVPYPYGFTPHWAEHVDPETGAVDRLVVVPAANAMGWDEGYGLYGTGDIDAIAPANDPSRPMLVVFAHDGDNAWSGGYSYYHENVTQFSHQAAAAGYTPSTIATYLEHHPVPANDVVHVEDGGWVNADGDFGSPQYINWNWPLVAPGGSFDIPGGWAEDERNWAVLTAAQNRVETAASIVGTVRPDHVAFPLQAGTNDAERAWHFLLSGYESGYMYYGASLDMEVKATLACNQAVALADPITENGFDDVAPTIWLPQRLPWNPGGHGGGSLWGYPGGDGAPMDSTFHVWTFVHDVSGLSRVEINVRADLDGQNDPATTDNETYAGGPDVEPWSTLPMNFRDFPIGEPWELSEIDFFVLPDHIADQYWIQLDGYSDVLLDYYIEAEDVLGNVKRSPIQHVYLGTGTGGSSGGEGVSWEPLEPEAGGSLTVFYDPVGRVLEGESPIWIHYGFSGWEGVTDAEMTWDAELSSWTFEVAIPGSAESVEFVFRNGDGSVWDNNNGQDWSVPVSGASDPPFVIDGTLDVGVPLLAETSDLSLWGEVRDGMLYVASTSSSGLATADRFLFACLSTEVPVSAPWAKSGQASEWSAFLAREGSNGWAGWFDASETVVSGGGFAVASGSVVEGTAPLSAIDPSGLADAVYVALGAYGSEDGGALLAQAPLGNGDGGLLGVGEYARIDLATSGIGEGGESGGDVSEGDGSGGDGNGGHSGDGAGDSSGDDAGSLPGLGPGVKTLVGRGFIASVGPNPFRESLAVQLRLDEARPVRTELFDTSGRRLANKEWSPGRTNTTLRWTPDLEAVGVMFLRVTVGDSSVSQRVLRIR